MIAGSELLIIGLLVGLGLLVLSAFIFWVWMLVHAITNRNLSDADRIIWIVVVLFLHFLGGLIYFFVGRNQSAGGSTVQSG